ncbi:MAG TPA: class I SAM-dependent methyltransferase [Terriglobales bacterium]|nr:class I SAM-dependent methyltransferase [Terriglobales bacterium]
MLRRIVRTLKKLPLDFGQYELRYSTKGKLIAYALADSGEGRKALDVGCRDGYWSEQLKKKGYEVVSCDIDPRCPRALVVDANGRLPFPDNEFDLLWCSEVIEHLLDPAFTIQEFKRVLKPEGMLLMTTPNKDFWVFRAVEKLGIETATIQNEDHTYFFTYSDMKDLVGDCEFYGYFPYLLLKFRISAMASLMSPTIVLCHRNDKTTSQSPAPALVGVASETLA